MESSCLTPCGRTGPGLPPPLLGRGSGSPWWPSAWPAPGCPHCPLLVGRSVLPPQAAPSPVPLGAGRGAGLVPSPAPASLLLSPAPRPFPTGSCPLSCSDSHLSLLSCPSDLSKNKNKNPTESQSLSQPPGPAGRTACRAEHQLPWGPPPGLLPSPPPHPPPSPSLLPQPGSLSGASPMLFRPTCGQGSHAEVWTPAPPPASLLASPRSLFRSPESRSSCLADRNPCPRGAWGWRARDRQQTGSTSRGVGGDEHWRIQLRGGAGREHGKAAFRGSADGEATTEGSRPWRRVLRSPVLPLPQQPSAGVPHSARKTGEPLHWRAGQRKPTRPGLSEGAAVPASGRPSPPRLPGVWSLRADAPAAVLSGAAAFSTGQTGPCFWHFC